MVKILNSLRLRIETFLNCWTIVVHTVLKSCYVTLTSFLGPTCDWDNLFGSLFITFANKLDTFNKILFLWLSAQFSYRFVFGRCVQRFKSFLYCLDGVLAPSCRHSCWSWAFLLAHNFPKRFVASMCPHIIFLQSLQQQSRPPYFTSISILPAVVFWNLLDFPFFFSFKHTAVR